MAEKKDDAPKRGRPALPEVYITASLVHTSRGPVHHGDRIKLPPEEAAALKKKGFAE